MQGYAYKQRRQNDCGEDKKHKSITNPQWERHLSRGRVNYSHLQRLHFAIDEIREKNEAENSFNSTSLGNIIYLHIVIEIYFYFCPCICITEIDFAKLGVQVCLFFVVDIFAPSRFMFWTDWGYLNARIERADLTGENRIMVLDLTRGWDYQLYPMSVVIDYSTERIYWMDAYDNWIDSADLDGNNRSNIHYIGQNIFPADLALHGDNLYWVDWNSQSIFWFNKTRPLGMLNFGHLTDVYLTGAVVSDKSRQPVGN